MLYIAYAIYSILAKLKMPFVVDFYREADGTKPVAAFIKSLPVKLRAKVVADLHLLEEYGNNAREPLSKALGDGIFEVRSQVGNDIVRVLYFFDESKVIIATNGFVKKQDKTPANEIELAKARRTIYFLQKEQLVIKKERDMK